MEINKSYYTIIPATVRCDERLTPNCKLLYGDISALCNQTGICWATNAHLAKISGVDRITVSRWVSTLEEAGHIRTSVERNGLGEVIARHIEISIPVAFPVLTPIDQKGKENNTLMNNTEDTTSVGVPPSIGSVNWENGKTDLQKLVAYYYRRFYPTTYKTATKQQVGTIFRKYGRIFSELLGCAGSLEVAQSAIEICDKHHEKLRLSWSLKALNIHWADFVDEAKRRLSDGHI